MEELTRNKTMNEDYQYIKSMSIPIDGIIIKENTQGFNLQYQKIK